MICIVVVHRVNEGMNIGVSNRDGNLANTFGTVYG